MTEGRIWRISGPQPLRLKDPLRKSSTIILRASDNAKVNEEPVTSGATFRLTEQQTVFENAQIIYQGDPISA